MHEAAIPALISVVAVSALSFAGASLIALGSKRLRGLVPLLVAMAAGALLGDAFLHLLPEASEAHGGFDGTVAWCVLGGVLGFFLIESVIHWHHHGEDVDAHASGQISSLAWMNLLGDGLHNFVDGLLIAGTWMVSPEAGIATTVAVALHEVPQEFGDFGVLLHAGVPVRRALFLNAMSAAAAVVGAAVILLSHDGLGLEPYLAPVAAGGFIYVACADLVPELHKRARGFALLGTVAVLAVGVALVTVLPTLAGTSHSHSHSHGTEAHDEDEAHDQDHDHDHDPGPGAAHDHDADDDPDGHEGHDDADAPHDPDGHEGHDHDHDDDSGHVPPGAGER